MKSTFEELSGTYRQGGADMDKIAQQLKAYIETHTFDPGDSDCETVLDQLYKAYAESHESDPTDNNAIFNLCCRLCSAYERKAFIDGIQYGAHLIDELHYKR